MQSGGCKLFAVTVEYVQRYVSHKTKHKPFQSVKHLCERENTNGK